MNTGLRSCPGVASALLLAVASASAELAAEREYVLDDSEEPVERRIYSYDFDVDSAGHLHAVYSKPVPGQSRCTVIYGNNVSGSWTSRVVETDGKLGSISTFLTVDPFSDTVHLCYIKHQNDPNYGAGESFDPTRHIHLAHRTVAAGVPGAEEVVERGGWHSRMQLLETGEPVFVREGASNLRLFRRGPSSWNETSLGLPAVPHHRVADFVYDAPRGRFHVTYGDSGQTRDVYAGKGSTTRISGTFHRLFHATSADGTTWTSRVIDGSYSLYEREFWTALGIDALGRPYAAMYRYNEDLIHQKYNTGTSLLFGRFTNDQWHVRTIVGGEADSRCGMGVGMTASPDGSLHGMWDSSPDFPKEFYGDAGNIALHRDTDTPDWNVYRMQVKPFSAEGSCRLRSQSDYLHVMVLGNHQDARLYLMTYRISGLPDMPPLAVPRIPVGTFSETWVQFAWNGVPNAFEYYLEVKRNNAAFTNVWMGTATEFWPNVHLPFGNYSWRIQRWVAGEGTWSAPLAFAIAPNAGTPIQDWPANEVTETYAPRFNWSDVPGASAYEVRVERDGAIYALPTVDGASEWTPASPFAPGTYEWWVRVSNPSSPNWSAGRRFNLPSTLWWDATPAGDGWKTLDWFGFFIELGGGWIYHYTHGFMYPLGETTSSLWLWTPSLGWLWTGDAVYPWLYRVSPAAWLWYARDTAAPRWFYNAGTAQWEQNP